jgi:predicted metal-dependent phosphoesterase TrpH
MNASQYMVADLFMAWRRNTRKCFIHSICPDSWQLVGQAHGASGLPHLAHKFAGGSSFCTV